MQFRIQKRLSHGLELQSSYTWSRNLDTTQGQQSGEGGGGNVVGTNPNNARVDKGPSDFNTPQSWTLNVLYSLPSPQVRGAGILLQGWRVSSIVTVRSGLAFTPLVSGNRSRSQVFGVSNPDRPDLVGGRKPGNIILRGPDKYFDPLAFVPQALGVLGTAGRNMLQGPRTTNVDFSLAKATALPRFGEGGALEFRVEFFNILNHANFLFPVGGRTVFTADQTRVSTTPLATAGQIDRTITSSRQIQFALKLSF